MKNKNENLKKNEQMPDIWEELEEKGSQIEHTEAQEFILTSGKHYYIVNNLARAEVICVSCPVRHGGIIDAYELARTRVKDGVIYLDGIATTRKPRDFVPKIN